MSGHDRTTLGLAWAQSRVRAFHILAGHPVSSTPRELPPERVIKRQKWMFEELDEFLQAKGVVEQTDAIVDLIYFALGTLVEMGVDAEESLAIVHRANMAKVHDDGRSVTMEDGKIGKPSDWVSPESEIAQVLVDRESPYKLIEVAPEDAIAGCLAMIDHALLGASETSALDHYRSVFSQIDSGEMRPIRLGPLNERLVKAHSRLRDDFLSVTLISEPTLGLELRKALEGYVAVAVGFDAAKVYRWHGESGLRFALVSAIEGDEVTLIDADARRPGVRVVHVDDLFAGLRSAYDGLHRMELEK